MFAVCLAMIHVTAWSAECPRLEAGFLDVSWQHIANPRGVIPARDADRIASIDLSHNVLSDLTMPRAAVARCSRLRALNASHNRLREFPGHLLRDLPRSCTNVDLSHNPFVNAGPDVTIGQRGLTVDISGGGADGIEAGIRGRLEKAGLWYKCVRFFDRNLSQQPSIITKTVETAALMAAYIWFARRFFPDPSSRAARLLKPGVNGFSFIYNICHAGRILKSHRHDFPLPHLSVAEVASVSSRYFSSYLLIFELLGCMVGGSGYVNALARHERPRYEAMLAYDPVWARRKLDELAHVERQGELFLSDIPCSLAFAGVARRALDKLRSWAQQKCHAYVERNRNHLVVDRARAAQAQVPAGQ